MIGGSSPGRGWEFSLHHLAPYPVGTRGSFPGVKRPSREVVHSPPSSAEVKNAWSYSSISPIRLNGGVLGWMSRTNLHTHTHTHIYIYIYIYETYKRFMKRRNFMFHISFMYIRGFPGNRMFWFQVRALAFHFRSIWLRCSIWNRVSWLWMFGGFLFI
jgi:hypothetical protein